MIGTILDDRYRVLRRLGDGGMGEVYLAEHLALGRKEALKVLRVELAGEPAFVSRFRREARATNRLQHPNIIGVHDFGQLPDGRFYLSTEYADGELLADVLNRTRTLPLARTLAVLHQLADAVDHAHERGVIHRDLKPENIVLVEHRGKTDFVKVLDFGIAKIIAPDHRETAGITTKGDVFGTVQYMSPEQIAGDATDPRIDLYALGCIAFELVVGEQPFVGRQMEVMHRHVTEMPVAPSTRAHGIPAAFDALVLRCLAKDPRNRFQTGRELRHAIEQVPGFTDSRSGSGGRRRSAVNPPAVHLDEDETSSGAWGPDSEPTERNVDLLPLVAPVRELAELLVNLGATDLSLTVGLAALAELDDEKWRIDDELVQIEKHAMERELRTRAHDAALRFNAGEVAFARTQALGRGLSVPSAVESQLRDIEARVKHEQAELAHDLAVLTNKAIDLTARRAKISDRVTACARKVALLCFEHAPRYTAEPRVRVLHTLVEAARSRDGG